MNGSLQKMLAAAGVGTLALGITTATSLAGEPIIMGTQRVAPDPGQRPRLDERLEQGTVLMRGSNPLRDGSDLAARHVPPPVVAPSKHSQNARDEKANWMMLNRGDLTDNARSGELFGTGSSFLESGSGRRDYFFERSDGPTLNGRQPLTDKALDLVNRPGFELNKSSGALARQDDVENMRRSPNSRDGSSGMIEGRKSIDEPGLGPLASPGGISGAEGIERWSSSINQAMQRRKADGPNDAQIRREQYLEYLGNAQYSGANYPANSPLDKYQREFASPAAAPGGDTRPGLLAPLSRSGTLTSMKPLTPASGGLNLPGGYQGNAPGSGNLPSASPPRRTPSYQPKVDYSAPGDPGSQFNFR